MELLKAKGFDLYVASSTETKILNETLQRHGLRDYFSGVFGIDQGNKIEHVKAVRVARRPDIIPFVGDSPSDVGLRKKGAGNEVFTVGRAGRPKQGMQRRGMLKKAGATLVTNDLRHLVDIDFSKALTRAAQGKRYHRTPLRFARMLTRHLRRK
jgi:phosphoglycolate phosphatase-like HAD superfamily hydrolase